MSYLSLSEELKRNVMDGRPTRCKTRGDYTGLAIPPCGEFGITTPANLPPWYSKRVGTLHEEIEMLMDFLKPSEKEIRLRTDLVARFTSLVESFGGNITVRPVGSYVTGLNLPTSDIDMVLTFKNAPTSSYGYAMTSPSRYELHTIMYRIRTSGFASKVEDVLSATTPLIRVFDKKTGIQVDLTASDAHGMKATEAVQKWMKTDPELIKTLITVVKMFLSIRRCGTTYTGGINSYVLVWMVVAWVKLEWPKIKRSYAGPTTSDNTLTAAFQTLSVDSQASKPKQMATSLLNSKGFKADLGFALKKFLEFYGCNFDYYGRSIRIEPTPSYTLKPSTYTFSAYRSMSQSYLLSIFDPADGTEDMGKKAYAIKHIQASFKEANMKILEFEISPQRNQARKMTSVLGVVLGGNFSSFEARRKELSRIR